MRRSSATNCSPSGGPLASPSTLSRFEQRADQENAVVIHQILLHRFVAAHKRPPKRLILDCGAGDNLLHGDQEGNSSTVTMTATMKCPAPVPRFLHPSQLFARRQ